MGDDANPCSRTAPCETFAGAIGKTATNGIIDILDPGDFGPVTITNSITIRAAGVEGDITATGGTGIIVNAPNAKVALIGLKLDGVATGTNGVNAAQVTIKNCQISKFANAGLLVASPALARVLVNDSLIYGSGRGVVVTPASGAPGNGVAIEDSVIDANGTGNLVADTASAVLLLRRSTVLAAPVVLTNGASLRSTGANALIGNGGTPTQMIPRQ